MEDRLKKIKEELDQTISPAVFFTEEDKRAVRRKIREGGAAAPRRKQRGFIPAILSFATLGVFFLLIGGFLSELIEPESKDNQSAITEENLELRENIFDPKILSEGDQFGGLELKSVSPSARYFPASPFQAVFAGSATVSGTFLYVSESEEIIFYLDEETAGNLPAPEGAKRIPYLSINNFAENKEEILALLKVEPGKAVQGEMTISFYRMDFRSAGEQVDHVDVVAINGTELSLKESGNTGVLDEVPLEFNIIPARLAPVYEKFYITGDDRVLEGVEPADIFLMFWQAFSLNHTVMMYELMEGDWDGQVPHYQTFVEKDFEKEAKNLQVEFEKIKANLGQLKIDMNANADGAGISVDGGSSFPLEKSKSGIWKFVYFF
jgi:hypothetical protein